MRMQFQDYYETLGLARDADADAIKRAYRKLARKYHPDVSNEPDAENRFKEVQEAYEVLKDPEKRSAYDQLGSAWRTQDGHAAPHDQEPEFAYRNSGFRDGADFSEFFSSIFGARQESAGFSLRGEDIEARIQITLADAYHGATRLLSTRGAPSNADSASRQVKVTIPRGVTAGQKIRLAGQGRPGIGGASAGDLLLEVNFERDPVFRAEGRDIHLELPVAPWEAALGARIKVPTLGGAVELAIPAGSQSGRRLRLNGRGLPGKLAGDQYVTLRMVTPPADSEDARTMYQRMAEAMPFDPRAGLKM